MEQRGFAEAFLPAGFGRNARLERIAALIDWAPVEALVRRVRPGTTGRPPYRALAMVRALLLQQWYGLSDPGLEEALSDRVSFRRFCGLALEEPTPDETTLCRFRLALVKSGTLIDATLVEAAVRCPPRSARPAGGGESRSANDPDASWTRVDRGRRLFFGYKVHVGVDQGSGLIRSRRVTPAKTYESEVADDLILGDERAVYADKAYEKRARREALKARGIKDRIQHRRVRGQPTLPPWQAVRNKLIGRIRGSVERTFSELKRGSYGLVRMRYRGLERCRLQVDLAAIAYNLRRAAA